MRLPTFLCGAIVALTLATYWQTSKHQFINFDDKAYVSENVHVEGGLTPANLAWAFSATYQSNWHPITWISHMLDTELYGEAPGGHHLTSVFIHTAAAVVLFFFLFRSTKAPWQSSLVAALFAVHPLHVESVAWIAERKDVLSAFFGFLTLLLYTEHVRTRRPYLYFLSFVSFVIGLMSKPMLVTLPAVMLLVDLWPLERYRSNSGRLWTPFRLAPALLISFAKEKAPFFGCSVASALLTIYAQKRGGSVQGIEILPLGLRLANSITAYPKYIFKLLYPTDLALVYPFPDSIPRWQVVFSLALLFAFSVPAMRTPRRYLTVGWFWFLLTLLPVIGLIQVGTQSMADRYTYIPSVGIFMAVAWGTPELAKRLSSGRFLLGLLGVGAVAASTALTVRQLQYWHDSISLYRHTLHVTSRNYVIHNALGAAYVENGRMREAVEQFQQSIYFCPNLADTHYNFAIALASQGALESAAKEYLRVLSIEPRHTDALNNLGNTLAKQGKFEEAQAAYRKAISINPSLFGVKYNLGVALASEGRYAEAVEAYREVLGSDPNHVDALNNLGYALAAINRIPEAIQQYNQAILLNASFVEPHYNLGIAFMRINRFDEALREFEKVVALRPDLPEGQRALLAARRLMEESRTAR